MDNLHLYIYNLYSLKNKQQDFHHTMKDKEYQESLDNIKCPSSRSKKIQRVQEMWGAYTH